MLRTCCIGTRKGKSGERRRAERGAALANLDSEISELTQAKRDIDAKLSAIDNVDVERTRGEIDMLENQSDRIEREIVSDQRTLEEDRKSMHELQGIIRSEQRRQREARDLGMYQETASALVHILEQAYARIRDDQVHELSMEMNDLFGQMAANVVDDEAVEDDRPQGDSPDDREGRTATTGRNPGGIRDLRAQQPRQIDAADGDQRGIEENPGPVIRAGALQGKPNLGAARRRLSSELHVGLGANEHASHHRRDCEPANPPPHRIGP